MSSDSEDSDSDASSSSNESRSVYRDTIFFRESAEECHERWTRDGDGWSHAFHLVDERGRRMERREIDPARVRKVENPKERLVEYFSPETWRIMGRAIYEYSSLLCIDLSFCDLSEDDMLALFGGDNTHNFPLLHELCLIGNRLEPSHMRVLVPFLESRSTLDELNLNNTELTDEGAVLLAEALEHVRIKRLFIGSNFLLDAGIQHLLSATNSRHFSRLHFMGNKGIRMPSFEAISRFLKRSDTELKFIGVSPVSPNTAEMLVRSLSSESRLQELDFGGHISPFVQKFVCDTTSFHTLVYGSNHQLGSLGSDGNNLTWNSGCYRTLATTLRTNRETTSTVKKMRWKLREFYFKGEFKVEPFADVDVRLMPFILQLVTKTYARVIPSGSTDIPEYHEISECRLGNIYWLIRNCHLPELFSFPSQESKIQELEATVATLKSANAQLAAENESNMRKLEALETANGRLVAEVKELRISSNDLPIKRPKSNK